MFMLLDSQVNVVLPALKEYLASDREIMEREELDEIVQYLTYYVRHR